MKKQKVLLGMSGGVDSSVSAVLLKEQGYEVMGATMHLWAKQKDEKMNLSIRDAKKVCDKLQIPHYVFDARERFNQKVIQDFIECYERACTPNPCIECNEFLKFGFFYEKAKELGCDFIATGHYARKEYSNKYQQYVVKRAKAEKKDQSYFLYRISKEILPAIIFPLQDFEEKKQIRQIASNIGLDSWEKPDSQEICFIPDNCYSRFLLENKVVTKSGNIVTKQGEVLGTHKGLIYYTIGQRKGLGISYSEPLYVIGLDKIKNQVIVGTQKELYGNHLIATNLNFLLDIPLSQPIEVLAKIRYRATPSKAILKVEKDGAKVEFNEPQRAITPGQSVVFYLDDILLGGGKIK